MKYNSSEILNANIGTARDNMSSPIHNWYRFTAGFSYKFVDEIIDDSHGLIDSIYEPFAGCGTTLVAAQKKGLHAVGNESQQLMCDVINAKLNWDIDSDTCLMHVDQIGSYVKECVGNGIPESHPLLASLYDAKTLEVLYLIRDSIRMIKESKYRLFLELALSQTLHKVALHPIAVPYIVRSKNLMHSGHCWERFTSIVMQMLEDLDTLVSRVRTAVVNHADSRLYNESIETDSCDLCITSPPYLNNLDYGEVSKVHTHFFEITKDWHDITEKVRKHLVTGATTHYRDSDFDIDNKNNSFFYDLIHSHAQTKLKGDVWGYIKALNSIHMEYIGTKTDYIYHGSSFAPSYTPVTRNLYKGVNNNGVIFKSLQINGQIYKNNSGNTYTNP